ncbi:DMT family transporter [Ferrimicrobium sp.]|uniref:DMT family transporter n=1 Tax=Ferrimicrobium sp. TaxID=2926050 RepID=UPI0026207510|nr:DMT family transporter [Ferrimicrobium sp.]
MAAISAPTLVGLGVAATSRLVAYPALASQGARYLLGALILLVVFGGRVKPLARPNLRDLIALVTLSGVGLALFSVASVEALSDASVAGVGVIIGCVPIVLAVVGALAERQRPDRGVVAAAIIVTVGSLLVNDVGRLGDKGLVFAVIAMLSDATFSLLSVGLVRKFGAVPTAFATTLIAGVAMLVASPPFGGGLPMPTTTEWVAIIYLGLTVSAASFVLWYQGLAALGVARAGLFVAMIPIGALVGEAILATRTLTWQAVIGVVVVFGGLLLGTATRLRLQAKNRLDLDGGPKGEGADPNG